ncbi:unnamed protein product [Diatraea saccharalis]|uniref:Uncharacterized protein n=1 Tax=Diatraea saccharalis TaxID=40085 RepID=A0A9N9R2D7_9NEOP|nr:unnamed protein product [Diatraea saccharalis]
MPEEGKKNRQKGRNDPKEQRRPRQRHQPVPAENKVEKKEDESKATQKPIYEEPGPEFYKSLKRETDDILKITEEENSKYKKKDIQSNWSKYEMPIESYDDIQEQENMGADYETLVQAPQSIGGYFQFKHEKSWDVDIGPSPYDKYFDINGDHLFLSLSTIPFFERNNIQKEIFTETDLLNMNNRATRFKQKYGNDVLNETSNLIVTKLLKTDILKGSDEGIDKNEKENFRNEQEDIIVEPTENQISLQKSILETPIKEIHEKCSSVLVTEHTLSETDEIEVDRSFINKNKTTQNNRKSDSSLENIDVFLGNNVITIETENKEDIIEIPKDLASTSNNKTETDKPPLIETPEDLEKWLDDFLDE